LSELPIGSQAIIKDIRITSKIKRRILDLGFIPGSKIRAIQTSPFGDPRAYKVKNTVIAIRNKDAKQIEIERT